MFAKERFYFSELKIADSRSLKATILTALCNLFSAYDASLQVLLEIRNSQLKILRNLVEVIYVKKKFKGEELSIILY